MSKRRDTAGGSVRGRILAAIGATAFLSFCLGCMSLNFGGKTEVIQADDGSGTQSGKISLAPGDEMVVYYPAPYFSPPNLQIEAGNEHFRVIDQKADHFKVKNMSATTREVAWKSRGMKSLPPGTVMPAGMVVPASATAIVTETPVEEGKKKATLSPEPLPLP